MKKRPQRGQMFIENTNHKNTYDPFGVASGVRVIIAINMQSRCGIQIRIKKTMFL